jgi:Family of unknown function (DUF6311)
MPLRRLQQRSSPQARRPLQWPESVAVNLLIAGMIGFVYILLVFGLTPLDPTNLSWLSGDPSTNYIAWELFRQDPHLHWPLTFTERVGYPLGDSIAFMDPIPLLAILLKPFSPVLPTPFQYLGIAAVLAVSLQFFFAARLFRLLLCRNVFDVLLPSVFFLMAPPMTWRLHAHYALANHWLLVAALCLFVSLQRATDDRMRNVVLWCGLLAGVAVGVTPYLALMVLVVLSAGVVTACWRHRLTLKAASGILAANGVAYLISAFALGLVRSAGGYAGPGYRDYSMNLLAPIDPGIFGALFLRSMPHFSPGQIDGYNYLGAGVLMVAVMLLPSLSRNRLRWLTAAVVVPLAVGCMVLTALAVSTQVTAGSVLVVDLDPHETLSKYLGVFRGSGRLFWAPYYVMLTAILASGLVVWRPWKAMVLITVALVVQFADTLPLRRGVRELVSQSYPLPFQSPQWSSLGQDHANLLVFPPWQCLPQASGTTHPLGGTDTPGGLDGFRLFGMLAAGQHMRTNSYYAARYSTASLAFHCDHAVKDFLETPLSPDAAYVVSPAIARLIAAGPTGPNACHTLDGFILCSTKTDFGLGPGSFPEVPIMYASGRVESWRDAEARGYFLGDWHAAEPDGIWSQGYGVVQFRLTPQQRRQYHAVALHVAVPIGTRGVRYRIQSGGHEQASTFLGSPVPRIEVFEVRVPLQGSPNDIETIVLITPDAVRPVDIGMNNDNRRLGLGVQSIRLIPSL